MNIYPNYTFSVPDKRLYTLYKGITVTPRLLQASNVSSYGQATFPRGASCLCFVRRLFTRLTQPRVAVPPDRAKAAARAAPSAPIQSSRPSSRPPRPHRASEASRLIRLPPCTGAYPTNDASNLSAPSASKVCILRDRRGWETRLQNSTLTIRAASVLSLNPYCILSKNPFSTAARSWQPGRPWRNASEGHIPQQ
jgi:hypothetical protein